MICNKIKIENFRNIEAAEVEFSPGVNLLCGNNAQGKTNLMEAIYLFARGKSFRTTIDKELIRFGQSGYRLSLDFSDREREQNMELAFFGRRTQGKLNGAKPDRLSYMIGNFRAVLFCPEHLGMIKGGPSERREFLNIAISQTDREYIHYLAEYKRALDNRNALLRDAYEKQSTDAFFDSLEVWSAALAKPAAEIALRRERYVAALAPHFMKFIDGMSEMCEKAVIQYSCGFENLPRDRESLTAEYLYKLTHNTRREIGAGTTLYGVHRDDLDIKIDGNSAREYASQGQQRSLSLALKLAEGELSREITGELPVFLLDDVLSELDAGRQKYLLTNLGDERQIIVSSCERRAAARFPGARIIRVKDGQYKEKIR